MGTVWEGILARMVLLHMIVLLTVSVYEILSTCQDRLTRAVSSADQDKLSPGPNLANLGGHAQAHDHLEKQKYVLTKHIGIVLTVENHSDLRLEDPKRYIHAGTYDNYGVPHPVEPHTKEVFIFHRKRTTYSYTAGSISWLVKDFWKDETDNMGYRLHMMWDVGYNCGTEANIVSVGFNHHKLTEDHSEWMERNQHRYFEKHRRSVKTCERQKDLLAGIEIGSGCLTNVTLKFGSKKKSSWGVPGLGSPATASFPLLTILLLLLGVVLGVVVVVGVLLRVAKTLRGKKKNIYRSSVQGDKNTVIDYHLAHDNTDEETEEEIYTTSSNK